MDTGETLITQTNRYIYNILDVRTANLYAINKQSGKIQAHTYPLCHRYSADPAVTGQ